jgi:uncharacterized protein
MNLDYPFHFDGRDRTANTSDADHLRDLIEQVLFTMPGERVNRPDFGSGVMQLVFAPNSPEVAATTEFLVKGALQQWLGDRLAIEALTVESVDSTLRIRIDYVDLRTQRRERAEFARGGTPP